MVWQTSSGRSCTFLDLRGDAFVKIIVPFPTVLIQSEQVRVMMSAVWNQTAELPYETPQH